MKIDSPEKKKLFNEIKELVEKHSNYKITDPTVIDTIVKKY